MIDLLRSMAVFASVAEEGSFSAAAKKIDLAPSRVSQIVSELERNLGVTILYRTTRKVSLTDEGAKLLLGVNQMLGAAEHAVDSLSLDSKEPYGSLGVAIPSFLIQSNLMSVLAEFAHLYPSISMKLYFSDRKHDLIADSIDLAFRAGYPSAENEQIRIIGTLNRILVASPEYVANKQKPSIPADLESWDWIRFKTRGNKTKLIGKTEQVVSVTGSSRIWVDSAQALHELATQSLGITPLPKHLAQRGIDRGELVNVLPEWKLKPLQLYTVWPDHTRRKKLTSLLTNFLSLNAERIST